jgi:hypothetical protein
MRINDSSMCHACHGSLSVGIIFSFHAGVPVCPIICPVNPAEPKTTTQYASKSLSGPCFPFISFVGRKSLGDTKGRGKIPRCTSSKSPVVQAAPAEISISRGPTLRAHRALKGTIRKTVLARFALPRKPWKRAAMESIGRIDEPATIQNAKRALMSARLCRVRNRFPAARLDKREEGLPRVFDSSFVRTFPLLHEDRFRLAYVREVSSEYSSPAAEKRRKEDAGCGTRLGPGRRPSRRRRRCCPYRPRRRHFQRR